MGDDWFDVLFDLWDGMMDAVYDKLPTWAAVVLTAALLAVLVAVVWAVSLTW